MTYRFVSISLAALALCLTSCDRSAPKEAKTAASTPVVGTAAVKTPEAVWTSDYGQGVSEYGVQNDSAGSDSISLSCNDEKTEMSFSVGGETPKHQRVTAYVGAQELEVMVGDDGNVLTDSHAEADNYTALYDAMRSGQPSIRVRVASGKTATFSLKGAKDVLPEFGCQPDFAR